MAFTIRTALAVCAISLAAAPAFAAGEAQDVVNGVGKQPVRSEKFGTCVHTKWTTSSDICAPAPAPRVEVVQPAPQPVMQLGHEELTIYFPFNKAKVTDESAAKLDRIADAVNHSSKVTKVNIVGYTDQIGSNSYNDKLSVKRAQATKGYLDTKMRIETSVLGLRGRGEADPVVDCSGAKKRKAKIECMAKDRRVEIEFEFQK